MRVHFDTPVSGCPALEILTQPVGGNNNTDEVVIRGLLVLWLEKVELPSLLFTLEKFKHSYGKFRKAPGRHFNFFRFRAGQR